MDFKDFNSEMALNPKKALISNWKTELPLKDIYRRMNSSALNMDRLYYLNFHFQDLKHGTLNSEMKNLYNMAKENRFPSLRHFLFMFSKKDCLGNTGFDHFVDTLELLPELTKIHFHFRGTYKIDNNNLKNLGNKIQKLKNLNSFSMLIHGNDEYTDTGIEHFGGGISQLQKLVWFCAQFEGNSYGKQQITDKGFASFTAEICKLPRIQCLDISIIGAKNEVGDKGLTVFAENLKKIANQLSTLTLWLSEGNNEVGDTELIELGNTLSTCQSLTNLILNFAGGFNHITDEGLKYFANCLVELPKLAKVKIDVTKSKGSNKRRRNEISKKGADYMWKVFEKIACKIVFN